MKLIKMVDVINEIEFQKEQMNTFVSNHLNKKCSDICEDTLDEFSEVIHLNAQSHFEIAKENLEEEIEKFETIQTFSTRVQMDESLVNQLIQEGKIQTITVIPLEQFKNIPQEELQRLLIQSNHNI